MTDRPRSGYPHQLCPGLVRVIAPNPSAMTYWGTNSYLLGTKSVAVIDPGPDDATHLDALLAAIDARPVSHIFVTHSHLDHSPLARPLSERTGAPIYAFGPSEAGRSPMMQLLAETGLVGGGEGRDSAFQPDIQLTDGQTVRTDEWELTALHTPGHMGNHLCYLWGNAAFSGDHVMGWASSMISPPDGDLGDFLAACRRLSLSGIQQLYPGHGDPCPDAQSRIGELILHRQNREKQILDALSAGPANAAELAQMIYSEVAQNLLGAAERNVLAHLITLYERRYITTMGQLTARSRFQRIS